MTNDLTTLMPGPSRPRLVDRVAANVRAECKQQDISQADVARALDRAQAAISLKWRGLREWRISELETISTVTGVPVGSFFSPNEPFTLGSSRLDGVGRLQDDYRGAYITAGEVTSRQRRSVDPG